MQIISCVENAILCLSADGSFDNWIDDGEVCNSCSNINGL